MTEDESATRLAIEYGKRQRIRLEAAEKFHRELTIAIATFVK